MGLGSRPWPRTRLWTCATLSHFQNGRGVQEKVIGALKSGFAFATIPSKTYSANTAWQKLNILTHNIAITFQLQSDRASQTPLPQANHPLPAAQRRHAPIRVAQSSRSSRQTSWRPRPAPARQPRRPPNGRDPREGASSRLIYCRIGARTLGLSPLGPGNRNRYRGEPTRETFWRTLAPVSTDRRGQSHTSDRPRPGRQREAAPRHPATHPRLRRASREWLLAGHAARRGRTDRPGGPRARHEELR